MILSCTVRPNIDFDQPMFVPDQPRHIRVLVGLASVLYISIPLTVALWTWFISADKILGIPANEFLSALIFGSLGSIISIMLRYDKVDISNTDDTSLFFMGFFKPITGAVFSLVALGIYKSGLILISLSNAANNERYFLITIFFLSGFSERFVSDMLEKVESSTARSSKRDSQSNTSDKTV